MEKSGPTLRGTKEPVRWSRPCPEKKKIAKGGDAPDGPILDFPLPLALGLIPNFRALFPTWKNLRSHRSR